MVLMVVAVPSAKATEPDAAPEVTATPFTVTVAFGSVVVGVTVTEATVLPTVVVYVVVLPTVPVLVSIERGVNVMELNEASLDGARVTAIE
jgi:hypothetical protein